LADGIDNSHGYLILNQGGLNIHGRFKKVLLRDPFIWVGSLTDQKQTARPVPRMQRWWHRGAAGDSPPAVDGITPGSVFNRQFT
jgi:hypothetical protein